jgi:hypothetical protein
MLSAVPMAKDRDAAISPGLAQLFTRWRNLMDQSAVAEDDELEAITDVLNAVEKVIFEFHARSPVDVLIKLVIADAHANFERQAAKSVEARAALSVIADLCRFAGDAAAGLQRAHIAAHRDPAT